MVDAAAQAVAFGGVVPGAVRVDVVARGDDRLVIDREDPIVWQELAVGATAGLRLVDRIEAVVAADAVKVEQQQREHERREVVGGRAREDRDEALPRRTIRICEAVLGIDLLGDVHAADLDEAAERNRRELEDGAGLLGGVLQHARAEPEAEAIDPHLAPARDEVVPAFMDDDQEGQRQNREDVEHHAAAKA